MLTKWKSARTSNSIDITDCILSESAIYCNKIQHFYAPLEKSGCRGDLQGGGTHEAKLYCQALPERGHRPDARHRCAGQIQGHCRPEHRRHGLYDRRGHHQRGLPRRQSGLHPLRRPQGRPRAHLRGLQGVGRGLRPEPSARPRARERVELPRHVAGDVCHPRPGRRGHRLFPVFRAVPRADRAGGRRVRRCADLRRGGLCHQRRAPARCHHAAHEGHHFQ